MKATSTSTQFMKILNNTETTLIDVLMAAPILAVTKIMLVNAKMMECPAKILAKRRIIKANGLVKIPKSSMAGIKGMGHFKNVGTSGQRISFQYSLVPNTLTAMNVQSAKTNVMATSRKDRKQAHDIIDKDKEESREQIGRILLVILSYTTFNNIFFNHHDKQFHKTDESFWSRTFRSLSLVPTGCIENDSYDYQTIDEQG